MTNKDLKYFRYWIPVFIAVSFVCGMWLGVFFFRNDELSSGERKLKEVFDAIRAGYVDEVDIDSLIELSIPSILGNLDPHSAYIPVDKIDDVNSELEGSFGGIGITFQVFNDTVNVVEVLSGGPSHKAGIQSGDRIVTLDGKPFVPSKIGSDEDIRSKLRGDVNSVVRLGIYRPSTGVTRTYSLSRGNIPMKSVEAQHMIDEKTGYVKVERFARTTYEEFLTALTMLSMSGAEDFVIDLRGNTGGFMETAILMANEFLPEDVEIVETRGRFDSEKQIVKSDGRGLFKDARVVVLLDEMSASSSEIFAGAIQDNDRGLIVGRRSFGKGLVQNQLKLRDGSEIRLTVQRYYTPSGRCIQKEYVPGQNEDYELEVFERYQHGETMSADSVKLAKDKSFNTLKTKRVVYGGGGIMPDVFVPNDTTGITNYYIAVAKNNLMQKFAYEFSDMNRAQLQKHKDVKSLLKSLPSDEVLLTSFVNYATKNGVPARWYYINLSRSLIVSQLKALIARDILGISAYYEATAYDDSTIARAVSELKSGSANVPIKSTKK